MPWGAPLQVIGNVGKLTKSPDRGRRYKVKRRSTFVRPTITKQPCYLWRNAKPMTIAQPENREGNMMRMQGLDQLLQSATGSRRTFLKAGGAAALAAGGIARGALADASRPIVYAY